MLPGAKCLGSKGYMCNDNGACLVKTILKRFAILLNCRPARTEPIAPLITAPHACVILPINPPVQTLPYAIESIFDALLDDYGCVAFV